MFHIPRPILQVTGFDVASAAVVPRFFVVNLGEQHSEDVLYRSGGEVFPFTVVVDVKKVGQPGAQIEVDITFTSGQRWSIRVSSGGREGEKSDNNANQTLVVHL